MYPGTNISIPFMQGGPWMVATSLIWAIVAVAAIVALVWLVMRITRSQPDRGRELDELYAKGLMSWDEYLRRRDLARVG